MAVDLKLCIYFMYKLVEKCNILWCLPWNKTKTVNNSRDCCSTDWKSSLTLTNTGGGLQGHETGTSPFVFKRVVHIARTAIKLVRTKQIYTGLFLCCRGDSFEKPCIQCDIENGGHSVPASRRANSNQRNSMHHVAGTEFCPRNKCFRKHELVEWGKLSLWLVP